VLSENEHSLNVDAVKHGSTTRKKITVSEMLASTTYNRRPKQKATVAPVGIDVAAQEMLDYIGEYLDVKYNTVGNDGGRFHVDIVLTNSGNRKIPPCCWAIFLYHMKYDYYLLWLLIFAQFRYISVIVFPRKHDVNIN